MLPIGYFLSQLIFITFVLGSFQCSFLTFLEGKCIDIKVLTISNPFDSADLPLQILSVARKYCCIPLEATDHCLINTLNLCIVGHHVGHSYLFERTLAHFFKPALLKSHALRINNSSASSSATNHEITAKSRNGGFNKEDFSRSK